MVSADSYAAKNIVLHGYSIGKGGEPDASRFGAGMRGVGDGVDRRSVSTKGTYTRGHGELVRRGSAGRMRSAAEWAKCSYAVGNRAKN